MVDAAIGKGAEISSLTDVEHAAERQERRSHAGAWERDGRTLEAECSLGELGEEVGGATSCYVEICAQNDAVSSAERDERAAMEGSSLAEAAGDWSRKGRGRWGAGLACKLASRRTN